jgi:excisionase family DNA binding protein
MGELINLPKLLNADEAAPYLRLSRHTVAELMRQGALGHVRIGRKRFTTDRLCSRALEA